MRFFITLLIFLTTFSACRDKVICPAFQSTYILDDSVRLAYYSYLWKIDEAERTNYLMSRKPSSNDTSITASLTPNNKVDYFAQAGKYIVQEREVNKSKYGIVKYEPYWLKTQRMKTAPMENVLKPDKIVPLIQEDTTPVDVGEIYLSDYSDSLALDSTSVAMLQDSTQEIFVLPTLARAPPPKKKAETKYLYRYDPKDKALNVEQDYYNKHFGKYLVSQPPKPRPKPVVEEEVESDSTAISFDGQSNQLAPSESDSTNNTIMVKPERKKRRKKSKKETQTEPENDPVAEDDQPAEKEEEEEEESEDDGF